MATDPYKTDGGLAYPLTKMNFIVNVDGVAGTAAFSEVSGIEASVDVVEFRQGNANSLAPVKIPDSLSMVMLHLRWVTQWILLSKSGSVSA